MRTSTIFKALFILLIGFSFTCSNDDEGSSSSAGFDSIPEGSISMDLAGTSWASDNISGLSSFAISTITITGTTDLLFVVLENTQVGEYAITETSVTSITYRSLNGSEDFSTDDRTGANGRLIIQERDDAAKTISGTFMGTLVDENGDSKVITEGLFNKIPYGN